MGLIQASIGSSPETVRRIAREAYTYGFPIVENYKTLYNQAIATKHPDFKAPINQIGHTTEVVTPDHTAFITPNTDTPYSYLWVDLAMQSPFRRAFLLSIHEFLAQ